MAGQWPPNAAATRQPFRFERSERARKPVKAPFTAIFLQDLQKWQEFQRIALLSFGVSSEREK